MWDQVRCQSWSSQATAVNFDIWKVCRLLPRHLPNYFIYFFQSCVSFFFFLFRDTHQATLYKQKQSKLYFARRPNKTSAANIDCNSEAKGVKINEHLRMNVHFCFHFQCVQKLIIPMKKTTTLNQGYVQPGNKISFSKEAYF